MCRVKSFYSLYEGLLDYITNGEVNYETYADEHLFNSFKNNFSKWIDLSSIKPCIANFEVRYYVHEIYEAMSTAFKQGYGGYSFRSLVKVKLLDSQRDNLDNMCFDLGYISRKDFYWVFGRELPKSVASEFSHKARRYVKAESVIKHLDKIEVSNFRIANIKTLLDLLNNKPIDGGFISNHKGMPLFTKESFIAGLNSEALSLNKDHSLLLMKTLYIAKHNLNTFETQRTKKGNELIYKLAKYKNTRDISTISKSVNNN